LYRKIERLGWAAGHVVKAKARYAWDDGAV
jgi:hypothetical protein